MKTKLEKRLSRQLDELQNRHNALMRDYDELGVKYTRVMAVLKLIALLVIGFAAMMIQAR